MDRHDRDCDRSSGSAAVEQTVKRRLTDKISDAISHAASQGRKMVADNLRLIHDALEEEEAENGFRRRSDDEIEKYLDRYVRSKRNRAFKVRPF